MPLLGIIASSKLGAPAEPVAGYNVWLDASDTATITEASNAVSAWTDKSANAYVFQQTSATSKPTTNTRTINSLNVIDFDGINDELVSTAANSTWNFFHNATGGTIFFACIADSVPDGASTLATTGGTSANDPGLYTFITTAPKQNVYIGSSSGFVVRNTTTTNLSFGTAVVLAVRTDPSNGTEVNRAKLYRNNNTNIADYIDGSASFTTNNAHLTLRFGGPGFNYFDGAFGEIVVYDSQLSDSDIDTNMTYLKTKWGI
jgi:hypothetical protein